jgi:hypothetical protein
LYDEEQMLEGRVHDRERGITRIDPLKENTYRLVQIHGLYPGSEGKRERYRNRLLEYRAANREVFDRHLLDRFGRYGLRAADALERGDIPVFLRQMRFARLRFTLKFAIRRIASMPLYLLSRLREQILRFYSRQCGFVLRLRAGDGPSREAVRRVMDDLVRNSFLDEWLEYEEGARRSIRDYRAMEQGAIIIEWTHGGRGALNLTQLQEPAEIAQAILEACARRHKVLFSHAEAGVAVPAGNG